MRTLDELENWEYMLIGIGIVFVIGELTWFHGKVNSIEKIVKGLTTV